MFDHSQHSFVALGNIIANNTRPLVVWCGAGLSAPAGLPTWAALRKALELALQEKAKHLDETAQTAQLGRLQASRQQESNWIAFRILQETLGQATYQAEIRDALKDTPRRTIPDAYFDLWNLRVSGILNLNIDRLASRAFAGVHKTKEVIEFNGKESRQYTRVLGTNTPFIANLHGTYENAASWVFTDEDLRILTHLPGYKELIDTCILTRTILFVGISADDTAVGGHLDRLRQKGIDFDSHFWITDKKDLKSDEWAEKVGLRIIRYQNTDGSHQGLRLCIDALLTYLPSEPPAEPIAPRHLTPVTGLPLPANLVTMADNEAIRQYLNREAVRILKGDSRDRYNEYEAFCDKYDEAIHRAWYLPKNTDGYTLMGFKLLRQIATGGFGTVFEAEKENGEVVAIKLLRESVRTDKKHLECFRRGVRSMRLLSQSNIEGVVKYHDEFEIPAMTVMDFVPGLTLHEIVRRREMGWRNILEIGRRLASVLRQSHQLPSQVLHRDMRPNNVMFKQMWDGDDDWDIVVLDFDLSYHKDAQERTIAMESYSGYLAPEQVMTSERYSTRNALVDSYGLGMTLYYLLARIDPIFNHPTQAGWSEELDQLGVTHRCAEWRSMPRRFVRMIEWSTRPEQSRRLDMTQMETEINRLRKAVLSPQLVDSAEMIAEEIASRCFQNEYTWDSDKFSAVHQVTDESRVAVTGHENEEMISADFVWMQSGKHNFAETKKWTSQIDNKISPVLGKAGWKTHTKRRTISEVQIEATIQLSDAVRDLDQVANSLKAAHQAWIRT